MAEKWLPVVGFEGRYEVSDLGRVRSLPRRIPVTGHPKAGYTCKFLPGRILSGWIANTGYLTVALGRGNYRLVHRLVCEAFHGPCPKDHEVCHGPNGKLDNRASQLRWGTRAQNHGPDKERDGTKIRGEQHHQSRLTEQQVLEVWSRQGECSTTVASSYGVAPRTVRDIWNRKTWCHLTNTCAKKNHQLPSGVVGLGT